MKSLSPVERLHAKAFSQKVLQFYSLKQSRPDISPATLRRTTQKIFSLISNSIDRAPRLHVGRER